MRRRVLFELAVLGLLAGVLAERVAFAQVIPGGGGGGITAGTTTISGTCAANSHLYNLAGVVDCAQPLLTTSAVQFARGGFGAAAHGTIPLLARSTDQATAATLSDGTRTVILAFDGGGLPQWYATSAHDFYVGGQNALQLRLGTNVVGTASGMQFGWGSGAITTALDTGLKREGAAAVGVSDGSTGYGTLRASRFVAGAAADASNLLLLDGSADVIQARIQGHSTQTADPVVVEKSDGTDTFNLKADGGIVVTNTANNAIALNGSINTFVAYGAAGTAIIGGSTGANAIVTGSAVNDLVYRTSSKRHIWTVDGGVTETLALGTAGEFQISRTITAAGTTGAQTINKPAGSVNFAAAASTLVVTNSIAAANSIILLNVQGTDATCTSARTTQAAGSFTITMNAACTAETRVGFLVTN